MNKLYRIKQVSIIILILIIIGAIVISVTPKRENKQAEDNITQTEVENPQTVSLCYYASSKTKNNLYDVSWIRLNILGDKITGEFRNLPAETDSKIGSFEGTVGPLDQKIMGRRANVWWNSEAEGMKVKEELAIEFGDGSATVGFGEMIDRGDGVYIYKDKTNLFYPKQMSQIDCESLGEKLFVEKYIRDNIKEIAPNKAILGGSWYVSSVIINSLSHTGEVTYEDGHIQSRANFVYDYFKNPQRITVTSIVVQ